MLGNRPIVMLNKCKCINAIQASDLIAPHPAFVKTPILKAISSKAVIFVWGVSCGYDVSCSGGGLFVGFIACSLADKQSQGYWGRVEESIIWGHT